RVHEGHERHGVACRLRDLPDPADLRGLGVEGRDVERIAVLQDRAERGVADGADRDRLAGAGDAVAAEAVVTTPAAIELVGLDLRLVAVERGVAAVGSCGPRP